MIYTVAVYELDRLYGGPEEGGWWYTAGELVRVMCRETTEEEASKKARRINRSLAYKRKQDPYRRPLSSVAYQGGHLEADVFEGDSPPDHFPEHRPYYE